MWCRVQECRGQLGERLKRKEWAQPVEGDLTIALADAGYVAHLDRLDVDRRYQVLYPLSDVRVQTLSDGILVVGYRINADAHPVVREVRQAWFCVPVPGPG
jgi:hypothetical protein